VFVRQDASKLIGCKIAKRRDEFHAVILGAFADCRS
jgi:hypothetical protein